MTRHVLVVGHADADGHIIAEQMRRNLAAIPTFEVSTVVDPVRTKDHKAWMNLSALHEIERCDLVFFVDMMFAPSAFAAEANALVEFAKARSQKRFFLLDHHPLPLRRLRSAPNLRALYRQDVLDCTIGQTSSMMTIAALCESQPTRAKQTKTPDDVLLAKGIRRAAALGGPLPGAKLSALLRLNYWSQLRELGKEHPRHHRLPRGRRVSNEDPSEILARLNQAATKLLEAGMSSTQSSTQQDQARNVMPYDFDTSPNQDPPAVSIKPAEPTDLEAIVMLLELAAIYLTPEPDAQFTFEELLQEAQTIGGGEIKLNEDDVKIVLGKASFLKKETGRKYRMK